MRGEEGILCWDRCWIFLLSLSNTWLTLHVGWFKGRCVDGMLDMTSRPGRNLAPSELAPVQFSHLLHEKREA